jgi:DNA-binding transcriptional LysR family regulator
VNWDDLRYVLALSRHKTLSRAATALHQTHTTVGRRLRSIEAKLGVRLFEPTPDGFVGTVAGHDVVEVAERLEAELLSLEARVQGGDERLSGKLRISTMDILFRRYRAEILAFTQRYPGIALTINTSDSEASLTRREADVALRLTNTPPEHLVGRKLDRVDFAVYASEKLAARLGRRASYGDFPWLQWDERLNSRWLDVWLEKNAPNARIALRVDVSSLALHDAVSAGFGAHFLACFEGDADPSLRRIGPVHESFGRGVWLLTLTELRNTSRVRAFMDHMHEAVSAKPRGRKRSAPAG